VLVIHNYTKVSGVVLQVVVVDAQIQPACAAHSDRSAIVADEEVIFRVADVADKRRRPGSMSNRDRQDYFEAGAKSDGTQSRARPNGEENSPNNPGRPMPNPRAALIGATRRTRKHYFLSATIAERSECASAGRLYWANTTTNLQDNTDTFRVIVITNTSALNTAAFKKTTPW